MRWRRQRPFSSAGDAPRKGKKTGKHKELTTNPFPRSVQVEDDRRGGSTVEQASSTSNGVRRWWGRFRPGRSRSRGWGRWRRCRGRFPREESRFGGRRREIDGRGRRRRERASGARHWSKNEEEEEDMKGGSHNQNKYLGVTLADRPPIPSGPSAVFLGVTMMLANARIDDDESGWRRFRMMIMTTTTIDEMTQLIQCNI